jgi:Rps23 Pro-64 3,4-dihydroxylase Tpa1-like proline 4-hydroxylase
MTDLRPLAAWIQPQHLEPATLARYRDSFGAHPARLIVLTDFLVDGAAERLNRFLESEAEYQAEYGSYSSERAITEAEWLAADEADRFFRLRKLVATPQRFRMSPNALTYLQFRKAFQSADMRAFFETISGLALGWSDDFGAHLMIEGDFLRPHSDDNRDRRLALVMYLSKEWRREHGGMLRLTHRDGAFTEVEPRYNTMIAFDVLASPAHVVHEVTAAPDSWRRLTIGGWYHKPAQRSGADPGEARP